MTEGKSKEDYLEEQDKGSVAFWRDVMRNSIDDVREIVREKIKSTNGDLSQLLIDYTNTVLTEVETKYEGYLAEIVNAMLDTYVGGNLEDEKEEKKE